MSKFEDYKRKALENPEVRAEYDALQPEYDSIQAKQTQWDAAKLTELLEGFSDDFMDEGRKQNPTQEREKQYD